jgi:hypothetical protein
LVAALILLPSVSSVVSRRSISWSPLEIINATLAWLELEAEMVPDEVVVSFGVLATPAWATALFLNPNVVNVASASVRMDNLFSEALYIKGLLFGV